MSEGMRRTEEVRRGVESVNSPRKCARPSSPSGSLNEPTSTSMHAAA
jgi:hypothetical protein